MIRPEIYDRAVAGHGRDRMTLAHEVGHLLLHTEVQLARRIGAGPIEAFRDPEWQAKAFAGELMVPRSLYPKGKHPSEVAALLGVSVDAVFTQLNAWKRER
jgi:Zn-dependent peptidase ImmA (M78 family)